MNSEQLLLPLGMPWNGVSPRYLTRFRIELSLASERTTWPALEPDQTSHAYQIELFPEGISYGS